MDPLAQLQDNVHRLLERVNALEQEVSVLKQIGEDQRQEIVRTHGELSALQEQYRRLQISAAMLGDEQQRAAAKTHVTNMIAQLDRAIDVLKQ